MYSYFFFFNDTATTEIYTLSLHDALPICRSGARPDRDGRRTGAAGAPPKGRATGGSRCPVPLWGGTGDRKSTRLNSSHSQNSYAVFCLKKKKLKLMRASLRIIDVFELQSC